MVKGMKLIWIVNTSKEIHDSDLSISQWSERTAILSYVKNEVKGNIYMVQMNGQEINEIKLGGLILL